MGEVVSVKLLDRAYKGGDARHYLCCCDRKARKTNKETLWGLWIARREFPEHNLNTLVRDCYNSIELAHNRELMESIKTLTAVQGRDDVFTGT